MMFVVTLGANQIMAPHISTLSIDDKQVGPLIFMQIPILSEDCL